MNDSNEEFHDVEKSKVAQDGTYQASNEVHDECPCEEELKVLISGGT